MNESDIHRAIQLAATHEGWRLFHQNVGMAWAGNVVEQTPSRVVIVNPRPLRAGLCTGSGDLIGWVPMDIGGVTVGVFASVEAKTKRGRVTDAQANFLTQVNDFGGIAVIARSDSEAVEKINEAVARKIRDLRHALTQ